MLKLRWATIAKPSGAASAATSMKRMYSSTVVPDSDATSVPQNPYVAARRTSWAIAASLRDWKSAVNDGSVTLQAPRQCSLARSLISLRV